MIGEISIYSQGEKIKNARNLLDVTQTELASDTLLQQVISRLENDKMFLTYKHAKLLTKKIDEISKEKEIELDFDNTVQYWTEDTKDQVERALNHYLDAVEEYKNRPLDELFKNLVGFIENLYTNYLDCISDELRYKANKKIYKLYYSNYKWNEGNQHLMKCYGVATYKRDNEEIIELLSDLIKSYLYLGYYKEAISYEEQVNLVLKNSEIKNLEYLKRIYYNLALSYIYNNEFERALKLLEEIKIRKLPVTKRQQMLIDLEEANCYKDLKRAEEATKKYLIILDNEDYKDFYVEINKVYHNLIEIEIENNNTKKAAEYFKMLEPLEKDAINSYRYLLYSIRLDKLEEVYNTFDTTIKQLININDNSKIDELIEMIFYYWLNKKDITKIDELLNKLEQYAMEKVITKDVFFNLLADVADYYKDIDINKTIYYLDKRSKLNSI